MRKDRTIFELKTDSGESLIVREMRGYEKRDFVNSVLYFRMGRRKKKIERDSFCWGLGLTMYRSICNVKAFCGEPSDFFASLQKFYETLMTFREDGSGCFTDGDFDGFDYEFVCGGSKDRTKTSLYLYRGGDGYKGLFVLERYDSRTEKSRLKLLRVFTIGEERVAEWKRTIGNAWESRMRRETERDSGTPVSDEEWQEWRKSYICMRTEDK